MGYYRRRRRRRRVGMLVLVVLLLTVLLVSCVAGANSMWLPSLFGTDVNIYRAEPVRQVHETNGALARELGEAIDIFTSESVELAEFHTASRAVKLYRDEILNSVMQTNYSAYVGNPSLSASVQSNYPYLNAAVMIPAMDFEDAVTRYLGANSVSNADGELFAYLSKSACYTTPTAGRAQEVRVEAQSLEETERTYRFGFSLVDADGARADYLALFVKRQDGSAYLKALERIERG